MAVELYKHNAYAYEQIEEKLKTSNRTCVIHPTGSGKSFIAIKWLYENMNRNCLFLTSQKPITGTNELKNILSYFLITYEYIITTI